jgi:hypothetical protein
LISVNQISFLSITAATALTYLPEPYPMSKSDDKFTLIESKLSGLITQDDITIEVSIYRGDAEKTWLLEVVDEEGTSIVWDDRFVTDQAALDEVKRTIETEGMASFLSDSDETKH